MTTPPQPQGSSPDLPDRVFQITGTDDDGNTLYRPAHPYMGLDGTERFETFRTWFVGEDGRTSIERERDALRASIADGICGGDLSWHPSDEHPDDARAVFCVVESGTSIWIRLGTWQHGEWKDTNTFENIGCQWWHELPTTPKQRERKQQEPDDE